MIGTIKDETRRMDEKDGRMNAQVDRGSCDPGLLVPGHPQ